MSGFLIRLRLCVVCSSGDGQGAVSDRIAALQTSFSTPAVVNPHASGRAFGARENNYFAIPEVIGVFRAPMRCDSDGNIYLLTEMEPMSVVHRLNVKGERVALFDPGF